MQDLLADVDVLQPPLANTPFDDTSITSIVSHHADIIFKARRSDGARLMVAQNFEIVNYP